MTLSIASTARTGLVITDPAGPGVSIAKASVGASLTDSIVHHCKTRGIGDFGTGTRLSRLSVTDNGKDSYQYNGDGLLLQGKDTDLGWSYIARNGDSDQFEHGAYVASIARNVTIHDSLFDGNKCACVKFEGTGRVEANRFRGRVGLVCGSDQPDIVAIEGNRFDTTTLYAVQMLVNARLDRFRFDYNEYAPGSRFQINATGQNYDLAGWQRATGQDLHSVIR